jgi:hypothetical protein
MIRHDITPISSLLIRYRASFVDANYSPARQWLEEGCNLHHDILPVLQAWTARKSDIYAVGFFTPYVRQAKAAREKAAQQQGPEADRRRAKAIAFVTRRLGKSRPTEEKWLAAYEAKHGRVTEFDPTA